MAAYFLDHVISPSGISGVKFMKLLDVKRSSEDDHVRMLAGLVKSRLTKVVMNGEWNVCVWICVLCTCVVCVRACVCAICV